MKRAHDDALQYFPAMEFALNRLSLRQANNSYKLFVGELQHGGPAD
jgi:hypothetical protein